MFGAKVNLDTQLWVLMIIHSYLVWGVSSRILGAQYSQYIVLYLTLWSILLHKVFWFSFSRHFIIITWWYTVRSKIKNRIWLTIAIPRGVHSTPTLPGCVVTKRRDMGPFWASREWDGVHQYGYVYVLRVCSLFYLANILNMGMFLQGMVLVCVIFEVSYGCTAFGNYIIS